VTALPSGEVLLVWTEGTIFGQGGGVAWQEFDKELKPVDGANGRAEGLPVWGTAAAFPREGRFFVLF
jgi:hypothetical protein